MVVARVFPAVNLASVFLWSRLVDTHARAMLNFCGHKNSSIYVALPSVGHCYCWTLSLAVDAR